VKTVCGFIGAQAMVDTKAHGGRNPLVELAASISILDNPEDAELDRIRGPKVADRIEDDPRIGMTRADPAAGVEASNAAGSYEAFAAMFGGPPPIPGREAN
jgi:hypothetical protein